MTPTIIPGQWFHFEILTQDGPLSRKVCQVTSDLLQLADKCLEPNAIASLHSVFPSGTVAGRRLGAMVGNEYHEMLYLFAVVARDQSLIEPRLKCTRPATMAKDPAYNRRGEDKTDGPDFVLSGIFDGENIHAAWDLTTANAMRSHYDRDILGIRKQRGRNSPDDHPIDPEIQDVPDNSRYWSSYIVLSY